ncbi:MAG: dTDP-4-dehydrorhamnose 3,5-epimerase [Rhodospirillales bacterium]|nr:dTDP-4-dehydrorhamnose 3,5-epimerase [Rhodospirillales bacterium]
MRVEPTAIPDVKLIHLEPHGDPRGLFVETFDAARFASYGLPGNWPMDAASRQSKAGTVRGLHFQAPPHAQAKLVRVTRGRAFDVALDIRQGSPWYGRHVALELSETVWQVLYIPEGFAHGFCALVDDTEIAYKMGASYAPETYGGLLWNDPDLAIGWPVEDTKAILTPRDRAYPRLRDLAPAFHYQGRPS